MFAGGEEPVVVVGENLCEYRVIIEVMSPAERTIDRPCGHVRRFAPCGSGDVRRVVVHVVHLGLGTCALATGGVSTSALDALGVVEPRLLALELATVLAFRFQG